MFGKVQSWHGAFIAAAVLLNVMPSAGAEFVESEGSKLLTRAMEASARASYQAEMEYPDPINPEITSGKFYRLTDNDGFVYKRLELYTGGKLMETFVENREGQFGVSSELAARIAEIHVLSLTENLFNDFSRSERMACRYKITDGNYRGIPCHKLEVELPRTYSEAFVGSLSGCMPNPDGSYDPQIRQVRPFVRTYLIGKNDDIIYSRTHYNYSGRKIFAQTLGKVAIKRPDRSLFDTPGNVARVFPTRDDFARLVLETTWRPPEVPLTPSVWTRLGRWFGFRLNTILNLGGVAFGLLGAGLIVFVAAYKLRTRRGGHTSKRRPGRR